MSISGLLKFKAALDASTDTPEKRELIAKRTEKLNLTHRVLVVLN